MKDTFFIFARTLMFFVTVLEHLPVLLY